MDYEQKLKEALECGDYEVQRWIKATFPHLAEVKEKKIIKILKGAIEDAYCERVPKIIPTDIEYEACLDWIEKQNCAEHWKPTKEQMDALNTIRVTGVAYEYFDTLDELIKQLKEL